MGDLKSTATIRVGSDVQSQCGACKELTKHTVLSMGEKRPLRVRCHVCDRDHNYRPPPKAGGNRPAKKDPDVALWEKLSTGWDATKAKPYGMGKSFDKGDIVQHSKFGLGQVQLISGKDRMRVLFETGLKLMVCSTG